MKIGMIQVRVSQDPEDNLRQALEGIERCAKQKAELIVLPELWNTPFDNASIRNHISDSQQQLAALQEQAKRFGVYVLAGTLPWPMESGKARNRAWLIAPDGSLQDYADKNHLLEVHTRKNVYKESDVFDPGDRLAAMQLDLNKEPAKDENHAPKSQKPKDCVSAGVCICYDIRFPEQARLLSENASLLLVPAGFNERVGEKHWKPLLQTRAMENQVYVIGVNPAACAYDNYTSYGHSMIVDPDGLIVSEMEPEAFFEVCDIDLNKVHAVRDRQPFWKLRRKDLYALDQQADAQPDRQEIEPEPQE